MNVEDLKPTVFDQLRRLLLGAVLPANPEPQTIGILCLGKAIRDGRRELRIAIGGD